MNSAAPAPPTPLTHIVEVAETRPRHLGGTADESDRRHVEVCTDAAPLVLGGSAAQVFLRILLKAHANTPTPRVATARENDALA